jgi:homocysteine S-methyltransferase
LATAGADLLACETIPCLREALVLAKLLQEFPALSAWMSFSCRDGARTCEGDSIAACAAQLRGFRQIAAIGVNCTAPQYIAALLHELRSATDSPLVVYPNSGESYDAASKRWRGEPGALCFADMTQLWHAAGARLIGGCCRTGPSDIRGVRQCLHPAHSV